MPLSAARLASSSPAISWQNAATFVSVGAPRRSPGVSIKQVPEVLVVLLSYLPLVFPVGTTRAGLLFGRGLARS